MTATYQYDVLGALKAQTGDADTNWRFTGELNDSSVARSPYYLRARYYDPALGRFVGRDPWPANQLDPQSWDRYTYVYNNPALLVDPMGLWCPRNPEDCVPKRVKDCVGDPKECAENAGGWIRDQVTDPESLAGWGQVAGSLLMGSTCGFAATGVGAFACGAGAQLDLISTAEKVESICAKRASGEYSAEEADSRIAVSVVPGPKGVTGFVAKKLARPLLRRLDPGLDVCNSPKRLRSSNAGDGKEGR